MQVSENTHRMHVHVIIVLLITAPSGTPQNLENTSISDTSITIQWEPINCRDRNGIITSYYVTYYSTSEMQKSVTEFVTDHAYTAMGLLFEQKYVFNVQGISGEYGLGPPASITVTTLPL